MTNQKGKGNDRDSDSSSQNDEQKEAMARATTEILTLRVRMTSKNADYSPADSVSMPESVVRRYLCGFTGVLWMRTS